MSFKPLQDKVLVRPDEKASVSAGGILLPESAERKEKVITGTVVAAGKGRTTENGTFIPTEVKEGNRVMFDSYSGSEIEIHGVKHHILAEDEIIGLID